METFDDYNEKAVKLTSGNQYKITTVNVRYGGKEVGFLFKNPATMQDIKEAIENIDDAPFGWRFVGGKPGSTSISVKIYND